MSKERRSTEISGIIIMTLQEGTPMIKAILTMHLYRGASMKWLKSVLGKINYRKRLQIVAVHCWKSKENAVCKERKLTRLNPTKSKHQKGQKVPHHGKKIQRSEDHCLQQLKMEFLHSFPNRWASSENQSYATNTVFKKLSLQRKMKITFFMLQKAKFAFTQKN